MKDKELRKYLQESLQQEVRPKKLEETITNVATTAFGIIKFAMYAIIGIPMIIVFIVILLKIKRYTNLDNQNIKENNRFQKKNKKSFRNNDDPFSL